MPKVKSSCQLTKKRNKSVAQMDAKSAGIREVLGAAGEQAHPSGREITAIV